MQEHYDVKYIFLFTLNHKHIYFHSNFKTVCNLNTFYFFSNQNTPVDKIRVWKHVIVFTWPLWAHTTHSPVIIRIEIKFKQIMHCIVWNYFFFISIFLRYWINITHLPRTIKIKGNTVWIKMTHNFETA